MASNYLRQLNDPTNRSKASYILDEPMDDMTEQAGSNREQNDGEMTEILVKWQVPGNHDAAAAKRKLLQVITTLLV